MYPKNLQLASLFFNLHDEEMECPVRVIEVHKDQIVIEAPLGAKGYPIRITHGDALRLGYVLNGAFYFFQTSMLRYVNEAVPLLVLQKPAPDQIQKLQRRNYFRVPVMLDALLQAQEEQVTVEEQAPVLLKVTVVDLSGGGLAFRLPLEMLKQQQSVTGTLPLLNKNQLQQVPFTAVVRRVIQDPAVNMYHYSLEFTEIQERDREKVLQYCFQRQLLLRSRT